MSDTPRRWFQVHLSTAVVMMFVAATYMLIATNFVTPDEFVSHRAGTTEIWERAHEIGWPVPAIRSFIVTTTYTDGKFTTAQRGSRRFEIVPIAIMIDALVCASALVVIAIICESLIAGNKTAKPVRSKQMTNDS